MQLLVFGLNHATAPLPIREAVSFAPEETEDALHAVCGLLAPIAEGGVTEVMILSTCNRTEFYLVANDTDTAVSGLARFISSRKKIREEELLPHTFLYRQLDAVRHVFQVASGLDSMVLGETQIVGQMKKAWRIAKEAGTIGLVLGHLFDGTFATAKEVRTATAIGENSVSLAAAGVRLSEQLFGDLSSRSVLFVGAGEMIELCAAHFSARHPKNVAVANRTLQRGEALAKKYGGQAVELKDLPTILPRFDILVSCTASALPIIGLGMVKRAVSQRRHQPIMMIDLAVPRDIEEEVRSLPDVYVYTVDDLGKVVASGRESRRVAVGQAERIIDAKVKDFESWQSTREIVPLIRALRSRADEMRKAELEKFMHRLQSGGDPEAILQDFSLALMNKYIHDPVSALRQSEGYTEAEMQKKTELFQHFYQPRARKG